MNVVRFRYTVHGGRAKFLGSSPTWDDSFLLCRRMCLPHDCRMHMYMGLDWIGLLSFLSHFTLLSFFLSFVSSSASASFDLQILLLLLLLVLYVIVLYNTLYTNRLLRAHCIRVHHTQAHECGWACVCVGQCAYICVICMICVRVYVCMYLCGTDWIVQNARVSDNEIQ